MKIKAPATSSTTYPLYFDVIRLVNELNGQSRDRIVPTLRASMYDGIVFWQETYRWSQVH